MVSIHVLLNAKDWSKFRAGNTATTELDVD